MIGYLSGKVAAIGDKYLILDVNGVGYRLTIGGKIRNSLSEIGSEVKLFTHTVLNPREGNFELYGFASPEELNFFELLTTVSGIGPKSAQAILSNADLQALQIAIVQGDDNYIRKAASVGEKTAKRLVLELKTKVMTADLGTRTGNAEFSAQEEAIEALVSLGYSAYQARDAVKQVSTTSKSLEDKVKEALRNLSGRK